MNEYTRLVVKGIVDDAIRTQATHVVFEDLEGIRSQIGNLPKFQQWLFDDIQTEVEAKLRPYGVDVETVDPRNTSKTCSHPKCGHIADANRRDKQFECKECGLSLNADYNAVRNIGLRYLIEDVSESVPASRTRSTGRVTHQLALVSEVLSVREAAGNSAKFASKDWMSTDKLTTSVVGG